MLEFHISGSVGDQQSTTIAHRCPTNETTTGDSRVNDRNVFTQFSFKDGEKVFGTANAC